MAGRVIVSKENNFYKGIKKLKDKKYRNKENLFLAEGWKIFELNKNPKYIIIKKSLEHKYNLDNYENTYIFEDFLFDEITSQENSQGVIFVYDQKDADIRAISNNIVVLDKIQDPGNLGTILRTIDAVGISDVILIKGTVDVYNEKTVRSSMGSIFELNFFYFSENDCIAFLQKNKFKILTTSLSDESIDYRKMNIYEKNSIIIGNEGNGVSEIFLKNSETLIKIPIYGKAESLNVGIATGIILYKFKELGG